MQSRQTIRHIGAASATLLVILLGSTAVLADRILVIGDSGAAPLAAELQTVLHEKEIFLAWFTFDTERPPEDVTAQLGEPGHRWLTAQGPYEGDTAMLDIFMTAGGIFDSAEPKPDDAVKVGTMTIVWHDCGNTSLTYEIDSPGVMGAIELTRIVNDNLALCEVLVAGQP
jgi:hypothetical protein